MAVARRLTTFVTNAGVPVAGLAGANTPEITIWNADTGSVVQASTDGAEIAGGFYGFTFVPTPGINYVARWNADPAAIGQVTAQERYSAHAFSEFFDDIVPEGGSLDYGQLFERLRKMLTNRAVVSPDDLTVTIYQDDGTTPAFSFTIAADLRERTPV